MLVTKLALLCVPGRPGNAQHAM